MNNISRENKLKIDMELVNKYSSFESGSSPSSKTSPFSSESPSSEKSNSCRYASFYNRPVSGGKKSPVSARKDTFIKVSSPKRESKVVVRLEESEYENNKIRRNRSNSENHVTYQKTLKLTESYDKIPALKVNIERKKSNHLDLKSSINSIIDYIFNVKLKINDSIDKYVKIFENNLILNMEILCLQNSETITKLNLPLALETEIKKIIIEFNKDNSEISTYSDIGIDTKVKLIELLNNIIKNNFYCNFLFDNFYDTWIKKDTQAQDLMKLKSMNSKSIKLFTTIKLIIEFLNIGKEIMRTIENMVITHLILGIYEYEFFNSTLVDSICSTVETKIDPNIKNALSLTLKEIGNIMIRYYDVVKQGKKYCVYYRSGKKWHKYFCNITHQNIIVNNYIDNSPKNVIKLSNIVKIEFVEDGDNRMTKQTDNCIKLELNTLENIYISTDNSEYIKSIYSDIEIRIRAYQMLE